MKSAERLIKDCRAGIFPNDKSRLWNMCKVVLILATKAVDEVERCNLTNEQFFIQFEDALNLLSVKDHNGDAN